MNFITAKQQIIETSKAIDVLIEKIEDRAILSQLISSFLRNLSEGILVYLIYNEINKEMNWDTISLASKSTRNSSNIEKIKRFHSDLQISFSHYTRDENHSERIVLKYIDFLVWARNLLEKEASIRILNRLDEFPLGSDSSLYPYFKKIQKSIKLFRSKNDSQSAKYNQLYYIHSCKPVYIKSGSILYEISYYKANDSSTPQEREVVYSDYSIPNYHAVKLNLLHSNLILDGGQITVRLVDKHVVNIRPLELQNFGKLIGLDCTISANSIDYIELSKYLTESNKSFFDIIGLEDEVFSDVITRIESGLEKSSISQIIQIAREFILNGEAGSNTISYLSLRLRNRIIKQQIVGFRGNNKYLSYENRPHNISSRCYPFETNPFSASLVGHNPSLSDLHQTIKTEGRESELLYANIKAKINASDSIYHKIEEFIDSYRTKEDVLQAIECYNSTLNNYNSSNKIEIISNNILTIKDYEDTLADIINKINSENESSCYKTFVNEWIDECPQEYLDNFDSDKKYILPELFNNNSIAFLYGPAGTGKSTMINFVSSLFSGSNKLFLAYTHPAINNLKSRVDNDENNIFSTVKKFITDLDLYSKRYKLAVLDEASTVDNKTALKLLQRINAEFILFVGDNYQIESIAFGNWFNICRNNLLSINKFELTTIHRADNDILPKFWQSVRDRNSNISDRLGSLQISKELSTEIFSSLRTADDSIILSLSYGGLYGINSLNKYFQELNPSEGLTYNYNLYKINDPVIFFDTPTFKNSFYTNQKGLITKIEEAEGVVFFTIELSEDYFDLDSYPNSTMYDFVEVLSPRLVKISLTEPNSGAESVLTEIPFKISYALSIHKSQGLEYENVHIIINEFDSTLINHNIFYTAVTRARKNLSIYWSADTQNQIVKSFAKLTDSSVKEINILRSRGKIQ